MPRLNLDGDPCRPSITIAEHRLLLIEAMTDGGRTARRFLARGDAVPLNPEGLPEISLARYRSSPRFMPARKWKAAERMVRDGEATIVRGSLDGDGIYLVAGPNWPNGANADETP